MNWDEIVGTWMQIKGKVKETWGRLTDNDLMTIAGKRDQLAGILKQKYGGELLPALVHVTISDSSHRRS
jgi:uncharacterized protein YjbJ (UPF0337 family)